MITINRETKETRIKLGLDINGTSDQSTINSGQPFFDHMLDQLATHAGWCLQLEMDSDWQVDDHHGH